MIDSLRFFRENRAEIFDYEHWLSQSRITKLGLTHCSSPCPQKSV